NSPPTNTLSPASARASTRPAFPASTVEMLVPHVGSAALAKDCGGPGGPGHTEGVIVVVVVVGSSTGTESEPRPAGVAAIPTIGRFNRNAPVEPKNPASPNENPPPSVATIQYPSPDGVAAIPTIGRFNRNAPVDPKNPARPKQKTPPSAATSQYP